MLEVGAAAALSLPDLRKIPAMRPGPALRGAGGLAGLTLVSASQIPADRIRLLGHVPYPAGRPRVREWGASPRDLEQVLDLLVPGGDEAPDE